MALYDLSLYGEDYYGVDVAVSYSVGTFTALQTGYGEITLRWTTPKQPLNWGTLRLVRSTAGYPATEDDGDILLDFGPDTASNTYTDSGLTGGRFYYYAIFLASTFPAYSSSTTYQVGDTVSYSGSNWMCVNDNTIGVTPATNSTQWAATNATALWNRAGQAASLAVTDYGYTDLLYGLLPIPYATSQQDIATPQDPTNGVLQRYLSVLAWGLDTARTELGEEEHLHRAETMPLSRMERLASQLGVPSEASITPRLRRYRVANAAASAKRRGTLGSIKEAIYTATGYDCDITDSVNRMLDADQAEFHYPQYPAWDPSVTYGPGAIVSYNGYLYSSDSNTVRNEAELLTLGGTAPHTIQTIMYHSTSSALVYSGKQVLFQSNAVGKTGTLTFSVPSNGTYDLTVAMTKAADYGINVFSVDGVSVAGKSFDGYTSGTNVPAVSVYLGSFTLTAGNHVLTLTVSGKNSLSGTKSGSQNNGYQMGVDFINYTPSSSSAGTGIAPTGAPSNNIFWTYYTAQVSHALDNALTGGISTWEQVSFTAGATASNANLDLYSGYVSLSGIGDNTANLAVMVNGTGVAAATLAAHSIPRATATTWDVNTPYPTDSYVSYGGTNYLAILSSKGAIPSADLTHWQPETISTTGTDRYLVSSYGIALDQAPLWSSGTSYAAGDIVQYQGQRYLASQASKGAPPSGLSSDTLYWTWTGSAREVYTASAFTKMHSGTSTGTRSVYLEWFDAAGNLITAINPSSSTDILIDYARTSSNLLNDPGSVDDAAGATWSLSTGDSSVPVASSRMAWWSGRGSTSAVRLLYFTGLSANGGVGITFVTAPPTGIEHGIIFRRLGTDFWTASRTQLTKTIGGTLTVVASWSALPDGARIYVNLSGSTITVFRHQGPGLAPIQLATVTDSSLSTANGYGIFERAYS